MEIAVRMNIDGEDSLAANPDRQARRSWLGAGRVPHAATAKRDPGRRRALQEISAGGHQLLPWRPETGLSSWSVDRTAGLTLFFFARHIAKPGVGRAIILEEVATACAET